jgi:hypothetical protein
MLQRLCITKVATFSYIQLQATAVGHGLPCIWLQATGSYACVCSWLLQTGIWDQVTALLLQPLCLCNTELLTNYIETQQCWAAQG